MRRTCPICSNKFTFTNSVVCPECQDEYCHEPAHNQPYGYNKPIVVYCLQTPVIVMRGGKRQLTHYSLTIIDRPNSRCTSNKG